MNVVFWIAVAVFVFAVLMVVGVPVLAAVIGIGLVVMLGSLAKAIREDVGRYRNDRDA